MPELIIQSRITSKKAPGNIIPRSRLLEKLSANRNKNLIIIESPAGYGKTTLVQDFLAKSETGYAWYHVTEDINNFYSFITYIIHAVKTLDNNFGANTLEVIESLKQSMQISKDLQTIEATVIGTFINEFLKEFKKDVYLVIDDLHKTGDSDWLNIMFENLAEDFPENLHIIITTRTAPEFDLSKFTSKRNLLRLDVKELRFDNKEIAMLLEKIYSVKYEEKDIELFEKNISGWITGIHLVMQAYGKDFHKTKLERNSLPENIFEFFANDIFNKLDENTKSFLINTALLENFTPEICNWLLKIDNSNEFINSLQKKNIFIESIKFKLDESGKEHTSYNYNGLFKQYLLTKTKELKTDEEILELVKKIFEFYKNSGDNVSAIKYALLGKDFESAVPLIIKEFPVLFNEVRLNTLWDWISALPDEYFTRNSTLLFYKGKLLKYLKGDMEGAFSCFSECLKTGKINKDERLLTECNIQLADTLILTGKPEEALSNLNNVIEIIEEPKNKAEIYYWLANVNYRFGPQKYEEVIRILNECIEICGKHEIKTVLTTVYNLLGNIYQDKGEFVKSLFYYELVVKNEENIFNKFLTLTNIIQLQSSSGEYVKAKAYIDEARLLYESYPSVLFERYYLRTAAYFRFECGDYEESLDLYRKLIEIEAKSHMPQFIFWYYLLMGEAGLFLNKTENASQLYELALSYMDPNDEYEKLEFELHKSVLEKKSKINPAMEKKLLGFLKYYETNEYVYSKAQIEFHLADFYFKSGNTSTALKFLTSSLKVSSEKQYISFLEQNFTGCRYLFDFAFSNGICRDFIINLHQGLFDKLSYEWLSEGCRKRLENSADELYDIGMNTLGSIEISVRGKPVTEDKWIRKKSKLILVYLLLNPSVKFTKDKMMDMFFQDLSVESAENVFHQAVTNIRNAVKPYDVNAICISTQTAETKPSKTKVKKAAVVKTVEPSFIIYEDKILRLNPDYYYNVDAVDFNKLYNKVKSSESDAETKEISAKKALELYKGDFLPGYYDPWCEDLRENLINRYVDLCEELINIYKRKKMMFEITVFAEKLLEVDKLNEKTYIGLIESYVNIGNVNTAKNKFAQMLKVFDEEYGEKPSAQTMEKINNVLMQN